MKRSLLFLALLGVARTAAAAQCPIFYTRGGEAFGRSATRTPLLLGGLETAACRSGGSPCDRSSTWYEYCRFDPASNRFPVCNEQQRALALGVASRLYNGGPTQLEPCHLYNQLQGRTLWLIGDSHTKQLFDSLRCFMIDFWDQRECAPSPDPDLMAHLDDLPAMRAEAKCIHLLGSGRVCYVSAVLGTSLVNSPDVSDDGVLPLLRNWFARPEDIFIVQFGPWHEKYGEQGMAAYEQALEALGAYYKSTKDKWPNLLFRETPLSHAHNAAEAGCLPAPQGWALNYTDGRLMLDIPPSARVSSAVSAAAVSLVQGGALAAPARRILPKYGLPVMGGFDYSVPLHEGHVGVRGAGPLDCLHYCSPGLPEIAVYEVWRWLAVRVAPIDAPDTSFGPGAAECAPPLV